MAYTNPGTLAEQASWHDTFNPDLPSSTFDIYIEEAPKGIDRKILELGFWLGVEPRAYKQRVKR